MSTELIETNEVVSPEGVCCFVSELAPQNDTFIVKLIEGSAARCFTCERSLVYRSDRADGRNGRFCSPTCQDVFDRGTQFTETTIRYSYLDGRPMRPRGDVLQYRAQAAVNHSSARAHGSVLSHATRTIDARWKSKRRLLIAASR